MKFKNYLPLAIASLAMVACNNEDEIVNGPDQNGPKAYAAVSITLPAGTETRAIEDSKGDGNALATERGITNVTLYVDGNNPITIDASEFTWNGGVGTATAAYEVTGVKDTQKDAYVVINQVQPTGVPMQWQYFGDVNPLVYNNIISKLTADNMFTMFSKEVKKVTLKETPADAITEAAAITVQRAAAKVLVKDGNGYFAGDVAVTNGQGKIVNGSLKWYIGNSNRSLYCTPQANNEDPNFTFSNKAWDEFNKDYEQLSDVTGAWRTLDDGGKAPTKLISIAADNAAATSPLVLYCNENTNDKYTVSNTTYVLLQAQFVPAKLMNANIGGTTTLPTVPAEGDLISGDDTSVKGKTFYVHKTTGFYFSKAGVDSYKANLSGTDDDFYIYEDAMCYYRINLKDTDGNLGVLRNHYYTMAIGEISGLGSWTDPTNPVNPNIPDPSTPAEPEKAQVAVKITVEAWNMESMGTVTPL